MPARNDPPRPDPRLFDLLADLAQTMGTASNRITIFRALRDFLVEATPFRALVVSEYDPDTRHRRLVFSASRDEEVDVRSVPPMGPTGSPHAVAVETGEVVVVDDLQAAIEGLPSVDLGSDPGDVARSAVAVPMSVSGRVVGGFEVQSGELAAFEEAHVVAMRMAANLAAIALEHLRLLARERESRREAEEARERVERIVEGLNAVVWEGEARPEDPDAPVRFTFVSRQVEALFGYGAERWIEDPAIWASILHPDDRDDALDHCRSALREERDHDFEYRVVCAEGVVRHVRDLVRVEPRGDRPARVRGVIVDVTETKRLESHVLQTGKMEAVGQLAGGVAHDFNNLLTIIRGNLDLLAADRDPADPDLERVAEAREAAARATTLTRQLLAFGRREPTRIRTFALNDAVRGTARMTRRLIGEDVRVEIDLADDAGAIRADAAQVEQALMNLALNARDAMPDGGTLRIATGREGDEVLLVVADEGVGMDARTRAHVFEPFFTTKADGSGLGLSTVYGIVTGSGGTIDLDTAPGEGATFTLRWPAAEGPAEPSLASVESPVAGARGESVLVVEDEKGVRRLARRVLEGAGYRVFDAPDGASAIRWLEETGAEPDLLLTDVVMPGVGGRELVERVRERRPDLRILFMSGYHEDERLRRGVAEGGRVLEKPFQPDDLLRRVRETIDADPRASTAGPSGEGPAPRRSPDPEGGIVPPAP